MSSMYIAGQRKRLEYPHIANNGLRVTKRSSQAVTLAWPENDQDIVTFTDSQVSMMDIDTELDSFGNWFEVQMRAGEELSSKWTTIYKGYGLQCNVDGLPPDSLVLFRMKRNGERRWGTEIIASTDPPPVTTDDLNRAVEMNSEYLVTRILGNTRTPLLKKILGAHDRNGMTPLMVACHNGNPTIAKMLLSCGARVNDASTGVRRTPLMLACIQGKLNIVQILDQHGADWRFKDNSGCNAMHHAINGGNLGIVRIAFAKLGQKAAFDVDDVEWTPLMRAAILSDNLDIVKFLVGKGADTNAVDRGNTKSILMAAIISQKPDFVRFLLEYGADPYYKNNNGQNCYEVARGLGYRNVAKVIRQHMEKRQLTLPIRPSYVLTTLESLSLTTTKDLTKVKVTESTESVHTTATSITEHATDDNLLDFMGNDITLPSITDVENNMVADQTQVVHGKETEFLMRPGAEVKRW